MVWEDLNGIADVVALVAAGGVVVDDDVVRSLEGRAGEEFEGTEGVVACVVDAEDAFDGSGGVELRDDRADDRYMGSLRTMSAILAGTGAPPMAVRKLAFGG